MAAASWRCYVAILVCWFCCFAIGLIVGYPSTALPDIASGRYGFTLGGKSIEAWYASILGLFDIVGGLGIAPLMDRFGRKLMFLWPAMLTAIGWLFTAVAYNSIWLFAGRFILGTMHGALHVIVSVYVSEISPKEIRGNAASGTFGSLLFGIAMSYVFGAFMNWRWHAVLGIGSALLVTLGGVFFLPETPRWLVVNQYYDVATINLKKLRKSDTESTGEGDTLDLEMKEMGNIPEAKNYVNFGETLKMLIKKPWIQPLIVCQMAMAFQQLSGSGYIKTFLVMIFRTSLGAQNNPDAIENSVLANPHYQAIIIGMCGVVGGLLSIITTDGLGRRLSLIASSAMVTLALIGIGTFFWLFESDNEWTEHTLGWLPLTSLVVFNIGYGMGLGPIPYVLMSELFPTRLRSIASGIAFVSHSVLFFVVVQIFGGIVIGAHFTFTIYAAISFAGLIFNVLFIPETKGRSLENIEKQFELRKVPKLYYDTKL